MTTPVPDDPPPQAAPTDATSLLRSAAYLRLLVIAAVLGVPISAVAYWFLVLTKELGSWLYSDLPRSLSLDPVPAWWPLPLLGIAGLLVGLLVRFVPGRGGESPLDGFHPGGGPPAPLPLLGIALAAVVSLGFGAVVGPEAPLIAIGSGLAAAAVRLARRDAPAQAVAVIAATGSFAAISALLGSPLAGAFLLMEAAGIGGPMLRPILLPGLLASGVGSLVFIGLDAWTGRGTFSLTIPDLPSFARPDLAQFAWAVVIGIAPAGLVAVVCRIGVTLRAPVERRILVTARWTGLRRISRSLPRWPHVPGHLSRRGRRDRPVAPAGSLAGPGHRHGEGGHMRSHAATPPHVGSAVHPVAGRRRPDRDAAGHRGRDGVLCRVGTLGARPGSTGGPGGHPSDGPGHGWTRTIPPADTG
jgi:hypothetical protein